jgi:acyl carrier protein
MPRELEIANALTTIFRDVFMRNDMVVSPNLCANAVDGWDSMKQVEILIATENHFHIKFTTREMDGLQSVGDLLSLIAKKTP